MEQSEAVDLFVSTEPDLEIDAKTAAAIARGMRDADAGRTVAIEDVPELITQWISKYATANQR